MVAAVLAVSILLQLAAAVAALRLITITGRRLSWSAIALAVLLMAVRRSITFIRLLTTGGAIQPDPAAEFVALTISALLAAGLFAIAPLIESIRSSQQEAARANRALRVLSRGNQAVIRASELEELLKDLCEILVSEGGYRMAWIGLNENDPDGRVKPIAHAGHEEGYLQEIELSWGRTGEDNEPAARAFDPGEPIVIRTIASASGLHHWGEEALARGYQSSIALPLLVAGEPFGALSIYCGDSHAFGPDEVQLLSDLAADLSYGIESLETRLALDETVSDLKRLQEFNDSILQNVITGIAVQDEELRFEYVNPAATEMLGYSAEELIGEDWTKIVPQDQREIVREADRRREQGKSDQYEVELVRKDGSRLPVLVGGRPRFEEGQFSGTLEVFTDISELVVARGQLRLQAAALDAAANAILITNREGTIEWVNPAWTELTGYSPEEAIGKNSRILKSGAQDEAFYEELWRTISSGEVWRGEVVNKRKDGSLYTVEETITPVRGPSGEITDFIAIKQDISDRKRNEARIQRQINQLQALREIDLAITASLDPRVTFNVLLRQVTHQLSIDAADILTFDNHSQILEFSAGLGFRTDALQRTRLALGEGLAGQAAAQRELVIIPDLSTASEFLKRSPNLDQEGFVSYYAVPLLAKGVVQGVLEVFHRERLEPDQDWIDFLEALAGQAAIAIDNSMLFDELNQSNMELKKAYDATLAGWARALELRDIETQGHSQRVTEMAERLARKFGFQGQDIVNVRRGSLLHDIGKMGIPDSILHKPDDLTAEEWEIMRKHPRYAYDMLATTEYLRPALDIPYCHHEKWDGSGYPRGLQAEGIPLAARIFAIVDVWDALRSDRPYRDAWSDEKALTHIQNERGKHFDPAVVDAFMELIDLA